MANDGQALIYTLHQGLPIFLSEGNISFCTTFWVPDVLNNEIVSGYVTFYQIKNFS